MLPHIAGLTLVLLAVACGSDAAPPLPDSERDEAGVYTAVLREYARIMEGWGEPGSWQYLLVGDHSSWWSEPVADGEAPTTMWPVDEPDNWLPRTLFTLRRDCLEDFARQDDVPRPLPELVIDFPVRWQPRLSRAEREAFIWEGFRAEHGGVTKLTTLSHIGFDAAGTQALVSASHSSGWLSSWSDLLLLERGPDGWRVVARCTYQVS